MATAADGTHPTGMHSCCYLQFGSFFLPVFHLEGYTLWSCCAEVKFPFFAFYLWSPPPPHSNCLSGFITIFDLSRNSIIGPDRWLNILKSKPQHDHSQTRRGKQTNSDISHLKAIRFKSGYDVLMVILPIFIGSLGNSIHKNGMINEILSCSVRKTF